MFAFYNIHTHYPLGAADTLEIESLHLGQEASERTPWLSAGLHPWCLENIDWSDADAWLRKMAAMKSVLAIGEAGLDKVCETPWPVQEKAFDLCLKTAAEFAKPIVVHCVKAYDEVLSFLKTYPDVKAVFHGFDKHPQTAEMVLRAGHSLSFGPALLNPNSHAAAALAVCPNERFFLETDSKKIPIQDIYQKAAESKNLSMPELQKQVKSNFENW